jgi:protein-L-isoaspartate(D-aspartate) O-methyltransferase
LVSRCGNHRSGIIEWKETFFRLIGKMTFLNYKKKKEYLLLEVQEQLEMAAGSYQEKKRISDIIEAMRIIDRRFFVDNLDEAYLNEALPIPKKQTISQPYTVARMLQLADIMPNYDVLEVGSGSGWNACLAAYLAYPGKTMSLERIPELSLSAKASAEKIIGFLKKKNIQGCHRLDELRFEVGNFFTLSSDEHQYDRIINTAGITPSQTDVLEERATNLLKPEGQLICPSISGPLMIFSKSRNIISVEHSPDSFIFVPLIENGY